MVSGASADVAMGAGDNNPSAASEEKMKVVVRVRPLQAREESWPTATETEVRGHDSAPATITIQVMW
jgi:hypothetical protein